MHRGDNQVVSRAATLGLFGSTARRLISAPLFAALSLTSPDVALPVLTRSPPPVSESRVYAGSLPAATCDEIVDLLRRQLARLLDACSRPELETDVITTVCDVPQQQPAAGKHAR